MLPGCLPQANAPVRRNTSQQITADGITIEQKRMPPEAHSIQPADSPWISKVQPKLLLCNRWICYIVEAEGVVARKHSQMLTAT